MRHGGVEYHLRVHAVGAECSKRRRDRLLENAVRVGLRVRRPEGVFERRRDERIVDEGESLAI